MRARRPPSPSRVPSPRNYSIRAEPEATGPKGAKSSCAARRRFERPYAAAATPIGSRTARSVPRALALSPGRSTAPRRRTQKTTHAEGEASIWFHA
jgi:hypothetical protein